MKPATIILAPRLYLQLLSKTVASTVSPLSVGGSADAERDESEGHDASADEEGGKVAILRWDPRETFNAQVTEITKRNDRSHVDAEVEVAEV